MFFVLVRNIDNAMQCKKLCKIARALNSTAISKYVTLKMTDVPSKHVWKIKESCNVYTTIYIVAAIQTYCKEKFGTGQSQGFLGFIASTRESSVQQSVDTVKTLSTNKIDLS